jgi:hypothetical protein
MRQLARFVLILTFFAFAIACDDVKNSSNGEVVDSGNSVITNNDAPPENTTDIPTVKGPEKVALHFVFIGEDEASGAPKNDIMLVVDGKEQKIATILACEKIGVEDYERYGIPVNVPTACGGWWAGGGDYFYARVENGQAVVYKGWQDEMQEDEGYHWEKMDLTKAE